MANPCSALESLSGPALLAATRALVRKSHGLEAELLVHLGEIDERKLYLESAFPSMFAFCVSELGFSEEAAYNRIMVARAGRRLPAIIEALRSGQVHLAGLRVLLPHLTPENHGEVLAQAGGKSKRDIEELVARLWPQPPVATAIRKLPESGAMPAAPIALAPAAPLLQRDEHRSIVRPIAEETYKIQFTASGAFRGKLRRAQDLLRHRIPDGDLEAILGKGLDLLIEHVEKERFATGRKPRQGSTEEAGTSHPDAARRSASRHIPDAVKRAVYERDGGRCTFADERGRRCGETGALEFDHLDGFARTHRHEVDRIRLLCRAHNPYAAEQTYGRAFMERARAAREVGPTRPGAPGASSGLNTC